MNKENIKGQCEHCGEFFEGIVPSPFPSPLPCPFCGKGTDNFDSASEVDSLNKSENREIPVYKQVTFK